MRNVMAVRVSVAVALLWVPLLGSRAAAQETSSAASMDSIPAVADVILMKNGSLLLGKLSAAERGVVDFEIANIGETEVDLSDIAQIRAANADFQVDAAGRERIIGKIRPDAVAGNLVISSATGDTVIAIAEVIRLKRIDQTLLEKLDGFVGVGYSYSSQSDVERLVFNELVTYATDRYRLFQNYSRIDTETTDAGGTDRIDAGLGGLYGLRGTWLGLQYFQYQKIPSTGVQSRRLSITGGGRRIVHNQVLDLNLLAGLTFQKERGVSGAEGEMQREIPVVLDFALGIPTADLEFSGQVIYYDSLTVSGRYRSDVRMNLEHEVFANFNLGLQFLYNHDSAPLEPQAARTDRSVTFNVGYTF
jgi:hypothetical protein